MARINQFDVQALAVLNKALDDLYSLMPRETQLEHKVDFTRQLISGIPQDTENPNLVYASPTLVPGTPIFRQLNAQDLDVSGSGPYLPLVLSGFTQNWDGSFFKADSTQPQGFIWSGIKPNDYQVFGPSGTGHSRGAVPDPGSVVGSTKFLREDANWATVNVPSTSIVLNKQDAAGALTGNGADQVIYTYSMPSGTMTAGKGIRITCVVTHSTGTASVSYKLSFGGTTFTSATAASVGMSFKSLVFNNVGSTTAQWFVTEHYGNNAGTAVGKVSGTTPSENTNSGSPIVIQITFNVANTDQVTPNGWLVEAIN